MWKLKQLLNMIMRNWNKSNMVMRKKWKKIKNKNDYKVDKHLE
jgi:hypothetical protein